MAPKKKRRRRANVDSGLGVSLKEKSEELIEKETHVLDHANRGRESELVKKDRQSLQLGNGSVTKLKGSLKKGSLEDNHFPETAGDFPDEAAGSLRKACDSTHVTEGPPNKTTQLPETEASEVCLNETVYDSDAERTIRELLETVNLRMRSPNKEDESALLICTACAEGSDNGRGSGYSSETEIFVGTSTGPKSSMISSEPQNGEHFSLGNIRPSQETGKSAGEVQESDEAVKSKDSVTVPDQRTLAMTTHSCPPDIGIQRQIVNSGRQKLLKPVLSSVGKTMPFISKAGLQFYHPLSTGVHFGRECSVIRESPKYNEQQTRVEQIEKGDAMTHPSTQSLSVWSEAQSEYFPRGKPSDLGELLEVATRYVVKAWVKDIDPSITGVPTNLVIKFCADCHRKYHYDEDDTHHLCSRHKAGSRNSLKLMFYVELEIYDETHEMLRVALTGNQATRLFGCEPQEFVRNAAFQNRVWSSFRRLIKGGNTQNWCLKDAAYFSLEPHLKGKKMNYRVVDIRPFSSRLT